MSVHKFKIGQTLCFAPARMGARQSSRACTVMRLLPSEDGQPLYRIKCPSENVERVVKEYMLSHMA